MSRRRKGSKVDPGAGSFWFPERAVVLRVHCPRDDRRALAHIEWGPEDRSVRVLSAVSQLDVKMVRPGDVTPLTCSAPRCPLDWRCRYERMLPALEAAVLAFPDGGEWWMRATELDRWTTNPDEAATFLGGPFAPRVATSVKGPGT